MQVQSAAHVLMHRPLRQLPRSAAQLAADAQSTNIDVSIQKAFQRVQPRALTPTNAFSPNELNVFFACQCAAQSRDPWLTPILWFQEVC